MATATIPTKTATPQTPTGNQGAGKPVQVTPQPTLPPAPVDDGKPLRPAFEELEELAGLDRAGDKEPKKDAKTASAPPAAPAKAADKATPPKTPDKPVEPAKDPKADEKTASGDAKPPGEPDPTAKFQLAHDLRKELRRVLKERDDLTKEATELRSRVKTGEDPEKKALVEQTTALRNRLNEVEQELKYVDYTKSTEFKDKFEKPFRDGLADTYEEIKEYWVQTADGERPATPTDFDKVLEAPPQDVRKTAKELFGESAEDVLAMRRKLVDLRKNADREAKRYREEAAERDKRKVTEETETRMKAQQLWKQANDEIVRRYPDFFGEVEGDDELNQARRESYAVIDSQNRPDIKLEDKIALNAAIRHRAAAFKTMLIKNNRLKARVTELEEALKAYEASEPGEGSRTGTDPNRLASNNGEGESAADEIDRIARMDTES